MVIHKTRSTATASRQLSLFPNALLFVFYRLSNNNGYLSLFSTKLTLFSPLALVLDEHSAVGT